MFMRTLAYAHPSLPRRIGLWDAILIGLGSMIGIGAIAVGLPWHWWRSRFRASRSTRSTRSTSGSVDGMPAT
jgi:hypothetical protein